MRLLPSPSFLRGLAVALVSFSLGSRVRADFVGELFTNPTTPAGIYHLDASGSGTIGQWSLTTAFSDSSGWAAVNTVNVPAAVILEIGTELTGVGESTAELWFAYTAIGDTTISIGNIRAINSGSAVTGDGTQGFEFRAFDPDQSFVYNSVGGKGSHTFSMTTGQTLTFVLTATATGLTSEDTASVGVRIWLQSISGSLTAIPEPGTVAALMGFAALGFVCVRRWTRRRA
ncbi:MAG TPA: hypothetical protein VNR00_07405 [Opitutus sp.]|nr:hypothetical protein [Opitutus sp.]